MLTQNEIVALNDCVSDVNEFLRLFDEKYQRLTHLDMGIMSDGTGFCCEADYICGYGYPNSTAGTMVISYYLSRDLEDYLNMEISYPMEAVGSDSKVLKEIYRLLQSKYHLSDEEFYYALDNDQFTVFVSYSVACMDTTEYTDFMATIQYVSEMAAHMLTNPEVQQKSRYIRAIQAQIS